MILSIDGLQAGECLMVRTPTALYHFLMMGNLVASVYRKGNNEAGSVLLEERRLSNRIEVGQGFMMFDRNNQPVASIIVLEVARVKSDAIPFERR